MRLGNYLFPLSSEILLHETYFLHSEKGPSRAPVLNFTEPQTAQATTRDSCSKQVDRMTAVQAKSGRTRTEIAIFSSIVIGMTISMEKVESVHLTLFIAKLCQALTQQRLSFVLFSISLANHPVKSQESKIKHCIQNERYLFI